MARIQVVHQARKDQGPCFNCRTEIKAGDSYKHTSLKTGPRSSTRRKWCSKCMPRPSQTTLSKMSGVYAAQEDFGDQVRDIKTPETWEAATDVVTFLKDALSSTAEQVRGVAEEYQESASNIEDGFGHATYQSEELEEKAQELEGWADDMEGHDPDDPPDHEDGTSEEDYVSELETWWQDQLDQAQEQVDNCPV